MTRYFCDRCKKEISTPIKITIEGSEEGYEVCTHCLIQIGEFIRRNKYV